MSGKSAYNGKKQYGHNQYRQNQGRPNYNGNQQHRFRPRDNQQRRNEEQKSAILEEVDSYNFERKLFVVLKIDAISEQYPSLQGTETILYTMEGKSVNLTTSNVKAFVYNLFANEPGIQASQDLNKAFQLITSMYTRKFKRELDYKLPDLDMTLITKIVESKAPEKTLMMSARTEQTTCFDNTTKDYTTQQQFYLTYRSFIPMIDVSNIDVDKFVMLKIYYNIMTAELKNSAPRGKPTEDDKTGLNYLIMLIDFLYNETKGTEPIAHMLIIAVLFQRISSIWAYLNDTFDFLKGGDVVYFNDENDAITNNDYTTYINKLKARKVDDNEIAYRNLFIRIIENIQQYKNKVIDTMKYDKEYRKLLLTFVSRHFKDGIIERVNVRLMAPKRPLFTDDPKKCIKFILNTLAPAKPGKLISLTEEKETELLSYDRKLIIETICERFQIQPTMSMNTFPLIDKYFINDPEFISKLSALDYSPKRETGVIALGNLFKLSMFSNNETFYNIFIEKNKAFVEEINMPVFYGIAIGANTMALDHLFEKLKDVFNKDYNKKAYNMLSQALDFYRKSVKVEPKDFRYLCPIESLIEQIKI